MSKEALSEEQRSVEDVMCPHGFNRLVMEADGLHCAACAADFDPTPWCIGCGAMKLESCDCGPIAENN